ncbi:MAG: D-glycerate dehydrogenase, partial [Myxococcaceae bacterium]|nr:D-glycerate dehydrogenase [Myxococcaceae bacterium]
MSRSRVFVTRRIAEPALNRLAASVELDVWDGAIPPPPEVVRERVRGCDGLLCLLTERIDGPVLEAGKSLKVVSNMAVGVDNVDVAACTARRIPVGHTPGVLTEATADFAFALLLGAARRLVEGDAFARSGNWKTWDPGLLLGKEVHGATLGLAGFGAIGQAVARRALAFGMRVLACSRSPRASPGVEWVDKQTLLAEADFLSLHLPLTAQTRHWLGAAELARMKSTAVLINTARGGVVDQRALVEALRAGRPGFAALDVTDPEPPAANEPLLGLTNVLLAPHLGSATVETRTRMAMLAVDNLLAVLEGRRPPHVVNPEV